MHEDCLLYTSPNYRLPRQRLDNDINVILETGVKILTDTSVGNEEGQISLEELRENYDAIYISIGAHRDKKIGIEGEDAFGVVSAVEFLREIGDSKNPDLTGKKICVIGGGNVAMDVARSSVRLGAERTAVVYLSLIHISAPSQPSDAGFLISILLASSCSQNRFNSSATDLQ